MVHSLLARTVIYVLTPLFYTRTISIPHFRQLTLTVRAPPCPYHAEFGTDVVVLASTLQTADRLTTSVNVERLGVPFTVPRRKAAEIAATKS